MFSDSESETTTSQPLNLSKSQVVNLYSSKSPRVTLKDDRTGKAQCWKVFKHILVDNISSQFCVCIKCDTVLLHKSTSGTTTLNRHACVRTSGRPASGDTSNTDSESAPTQSKINRYLVRPAPTGATKTAITKDLVTAAVAMVAKDLRPFLVVEGEGFLEFCQVLVELGSKHQNFNIKDMMPKANTISANVNKVYQGLKQTLKDKVKGCFGVGFSSDFWVHDCTKTNYFTTTLHFIKSNKLSSRVLCTLETENKTSATTSAAFKRVMEDYGLQSVPYIMVTDNAQSMISAFRASLWLGCSAHNLNLVLQHSYANFADDSVAQDAHTVLEKCKALVTYVKRSGIQNKLEKTLKQAINVRWDSHLDMLESIEVNYQKLGELADENETLSDHFLGIDDEVLLHIITALKPFRENRKLLCYDAQPTLHNVALVRAKLERATNITNTDSVILAAMKKILKHNLQRYFPVNDHHRVATLLAPRFKGLAFASAPERKAARDLLKDFMQRLYQGEERTAEAETVLDAGHDYFDEFADSRVPQADEGSAEQVIAKEVTAYLSATFPNAELDKPLLDFWGSKHLVFPNIAKVASWLLAVPASSAASERNFSYAGLTLTDRRSQLDPEGVNELLFIRSNYDLLKM